MKYPESQVSFKGDRFVVAVICSFDYDEPVDVLVEAANALPDVQFYVTGNPEKARARVPALPANVQLTGFLADADYGQLLRTSDVVMALTTGKHKMLRAAYEAIYQGTPIIISESPMLQEEFGHGAILVDNSLESIVAAIREMRADLERYRREALQLRGVKEDRWERNRQLLSGKLALAGKRARRDAIA